MRVWQVLHTHVQVVWRAVPERLVLLRRHQHMRTPTISCAGVSKAAWTKLAQDIVGHERTIAFLIYAIFLDAAGKESIISLSKVKTEIFSNNSDA